MNPSPSFNKKSDAHKIHDKDKDHFFTGGSFDQTDLNKKSVQNEINRLKSFSGIKSIAESSSLQKSGNAHHHMNNMNAQSSDSISDHSHYSNSPGSRIERRIQSLQKRLLKGFDSDENASHRSDETKSSRKPVRKAKLPITNETDSITDKLSEPLMRKKPRHHFEMDKIQMLEERIKRMERRSFVRHITE
jgi:hypothetical protein